MPGSSTIPWGAYNLLKRGPVSCYQLGKCSPWEKGCGDHSPQPCLVLGAADVSVTTVWTTGPCVMEVVESVLQFSMKGFS